MQKEAAINKGPHAQRAENGANHIAVIDERQRTHPQKRTPQLVDSARRGRRDSTPPRTVVLRAMNFVMTAPAVSTPMSKRVKSKSSKSCTCVNASPERVATKKNPNSQVHAREAEATYVELLRVCKRSRAECRTGDERRQRRAKPANPEAAREECKDRQDDMTLESVHGPRANPPA